MHVEFAGAGRGLAGALVALRACELGAGGGVGDEAHCGDVLGVEGALGEILGGGGRGVGVEAEEVAVGVV